VGIRVWRLRTVSGRTGQAAADGLTCYNMLSCALYALLLRSPSVLHFNAGGRAWCCSLPPWLSPRAMSFSLRFLGLLRVAAARMRLLLLFGKTANGRWAGCGRTATAAAEKMLASLTDVDGGLEYRQAVSICFADACRAASAAVRAFRRGTPLLT